MSEERRAIDGPPVSGRPRIPGRQAPPSDGRPDDPAPPSPDPVQDLTHRGQPSSNGAEWAAPPDAADMAAPTADRAGQQDATRAAPPAADQAAQPGTTFRVPPQQSAHARQRQAVPDGTRLPREAHPAEVATDEVKIGLWGSPSSGKTTFLGALRHAVQTDRAMGKWAIVPGNENSEQILVNLTHTLVRLQQFPQATPIGAEVELLWHFIGDLASPDTGSRRPWPWTRRRQAGSRFLLNLIDVSGEAFSHDPSAGQQLAANAKALDHLAASQGLLYLFDPIGEEELRNSVEYVNNTITKLSRRMLSEGRLIGQYLPQHVSVCITKFDHPEFFQQARRARLVNSGRDGMPRILDNDAETIFNLICDGNFWEFRDERSRASAQFIRNELTNRFHPDRIRYFVSSSIGFRRPPGWDPAAGVGLDSGIDPENFANVHEVDGKLCIRGPISPINVLEPLISLQRRLSGAAGSRG